jgi:hypothetical protein
MIVKIQRPIFPPNADVLIYDRSRTVNQLRPLDAALRKLLGDAFKVYAHARLDPDAGLLLGDKLDNDPDW